MTSTIDLSDVAAGLRSVTAISVTLGLVAAVETAIPLHAKSPWRRAHLGPNLALTMITFGTNFAFNLMLLAWLRGLHAQRSGILGIAPLSPWAQATIVVAVLDFSFYVAHVAMHKVPVLWRFHRVHHSDPFVDVTTTIRQHPGESVIRYVFLAVFAGVLGASPHSFGVYRVWSAINGLFEHANVRMPLWLDSALSLVTTWPHMHKIHHSRSAVETDTNYGNIFSIWDRMFATFTPSKYGVDVIYGLDDLDDAATRTTRRLLSLPFRDMGLSGAREPHRC